MSAFILKRSAQRSRAGAFTQGMKSDDALLIAWNETLANKRDTAAIFEASGKVSNTFSGIETQARHFERQIAKFDSGSVIAIQIGNDPDWPALLLACLRRKLVALPLEQSIGEAERDAALTICGARALITGSAATDVDKQPKAAGTAGCT